MSRNKKNCRFDASMEYSNFNKKKIIENIFIKRIIIIKIVYIFALII